MAKFRKWHIPNRRHTANKRSNCVTMRTPIWHWTLHAQECRFIPDQGRPYVDLLARGLLSFQLSLPMGFSFCHRFSANDGTKAQQRTQAKRFSELQPESAKNAKTWLKLANGFNRQHSIRAYVSSRSTFWYWMFLTDSGQPLAYAQRRVELQSATAHHDYLAFARNKRSGGCGAQILANAKYVYEKIGVRKILLVAGLSAGSAVWPRLGFAPATCEAWASVKETVRNNLTRLDPVLHEVFNTTHKRSLDAAVKAAIDTEDPLAIFDLVDIDPGGLAGRQAALPHGYAGELLRGGHWKGELDLGGVGGHRLSHYLAARGVIGASDLD